MSGRAREPFWLCLLWLCGLAVAWFALGFAAAKLLMAGIM